MSGDDGRNGTRNGTASACRSESASDLATAVAAKGVVLVTARL